MQSSLYSKVKNNINFTKPMEKDIIELNTKEAVDEAVQKAELMNPAMQLKVTDDSSFKLAGEYMSQVKEAKKFIKAIKDKVLKPLKQAKENFEALYEGPEMMIESVDEHLRAQISTYNTKLIKDREIEAAKVVEQVKQGVPIETVVSKVEDTQKKVDAIPTRKVWRVSVVDFSLVPDEYKLLDESKAKKAAQANLKVAGLEFKQEDIIVNRF